MKALTAILKGVFICRPTLNIDIQNTHIHTYSRLDRAIEGCLVPWGPLSGAEQNKTNLPDLPNCLLSYG